MEGEEVDEAEQAQTAKRVGNYRPGSYPYADEANVFGEFYAAYAETYGNPAKFPDRSSYLEACEKRFNAAYWWAWSLARHDEEFKQWYQVYEGSEGLGPDDWIMILGWCKAALANADRYGYPGVPVLGVGPRRSNAARSGTPAD